MPRIKGALGVQSTDPQAQYGTPRQIEQVFGLSTSFLAKYRSQGCGPAYVKAFGKVLYKFTDVEEWLEARKVRSTRDYSEKMAKQAEEDRPVADNSTSCSPLRLSHN